MEQREEWWAPRDIFFTQEQILWLLRHLYRIREGYWPEEHRETGYEYRGGKPSGRKHASFEAPAAIAAELEYRMEKCGVDGLIMEYIVLADHMDMDVVDQKLAHYLHTTPVDIRRRFRLALKYCRGWWRKKVSYRRYCIQRQSYEQKKESK